MLTWSTKDRRLVAITTHIKRPQRAKRTEVQMSKANDLNALLGAEKLGDMSQFSKGDLLLSIDDFAIKHLLPMVSSALQA